MMCNAKVKFSCLGFAEGNSTMWYQIGFDCEYGTVMTDKVCINDVEQISNILNILELHSWEELPRKFARIKIEGKKVTAIGNLIENKWLVIAKSVSLENLTKTEYSY